jgi:hypothetical protein
MDDKSPPRRDELFHGLDGRMSEASVEGLDLIGFTVGPRGLGVDVVNEGSGDVSRGEAASVLLGVDEGGVLSERLERLR